MARCIVCGKEASYIEADGNWKALAYYTRPAREDPGILAYRRTHMIIEVVPFCSVNVRELVNTPDLKNVWGICPECLNQERGGEKQ